MKIIIIRRVIPPKGLFPLFPALFQVTVDVLLMKWRDHIWASIQPKGPTLNHSLLCSILTFLWNAETAALTHEPRHSPDILIILFRCYTGPRPLALFLMLWAVFLYAGWHLEVDSIPWALEPVPFPLFSHLPLLSLFRPACFIRDQEHTTCHMLMCEEPSRFTRAYVIRGSSQPERLNRQIEMPRTFSKEAESRADPVGDTKMMQMKGGETVVDCLK